MTRTSLLPPNATPFERSLEDAFARRLDALPAEAPRDATISGRCPEALLPWLAWQRSVDRWDPDWPVPIKRQAIAESWAEHARKGTVGAVKRALESVGAVYDLVENPGGAHHTLDIEVHNTLTMQSSTAPLREQLEAVMRASVDWTLEVSAGLRADVKVAGGVGAASVVFMEVAA